MESAGALEGVLYMDAVYNGHQITDSFTVRITTSNPNSERIPALYEIGGRTEAIARKYNIADLWTLHRNRDDTACVCVKQEEEQKFPTGSRLLVFVENLVVPYLYALSHYDRFRKWPWGEYSHGALGILEFYAENTQTQTVESITEILVALHRYTEWSKYRKQLRSPSAKRDCLCGSEKRFGKCHIGAWHGVVRFRNEIRRLNLLHLIG